MDKPSLPLAAAATVSPEATAEVILRDELRRGEYIQKVYTVDEALAKKLIKEEKILNFIATIFAYIIASPFLVLLFVLSGPCGLYYFSKENYVVQLNEYTRSSTVVTNKGIYFISAELSLKTPSSMWGIPISTERKKRQRITYTKWKDVKNIGLDFSGVPPLSLHKIAHHTVCINDGQEHCFYVEQTQPVIEELTVFQTRALREWDDLRDDIVAVAVPV